MRKLVIPLGSTLSEKQYRQFLKHAYSIMWERGCISSSEDEDALELVHLIPSVPETILALHIGINDSVCTKSIVSPFLPRRAHHTIFANGLLDVLTFTLQTLRAHHEASGARVAILTSYRANTRIFNLQLILPDILSVSSWINGRWSILLTDRELT